MSSSPRLVDSGRARQAPTDVPHDAAEISVHPLQNLLHLRDLPLLALHDPPA
jgi:hypothetical protein